MAKDPPETSAEGAFEAWVAPHLAALARYAGRLVGPAEREDVVQEALVRAWTRWSTYDGSRGTPQGWLLAIVADRARKSRTRRRPTLVELVELDGPVSANGADIDLERAIAGLTDRQRTAVDLYYFVDLDIAGIAEVMGCAPGTVKATLSQARDKLRLALGDDHD